MPQVTSVDLRARGAPSDALGRGLRPRHVHRRDRPVRWADHRRPSAAFRARPVGQGPRNGAKPIGELGIRPVTIARPGRIRSRRRRNSSVGAPRTGSSRAASDLSGRRELPHPCRRDHDFGTRGRRRALTGRAAPRRRGNDGRASAHRQPVLFRPACPRPSAAPTTMYSCRPNPLRSTGKWS